MWSRYLSAALIAGVLGAGAARGQGYMPTPVGAARIPEPYPINEPLPPMTPGPLNSYTLPAVPNDDLTLPAGHSSAFQCQQFVHDEGVFFHVGALMLQRQDLGNKLIAVQDTVGVDNGSTGSEGGSLANLSDVHQHMQMGVAATVGYLWESQAIEITTKYLFAGNVGNGYVAPQQIDGLFFNPPTGFGGVNGTNLFLQADEMNFQLQTTLTSVEVNYHYTSPAVTEGELILGLRYLNFREHLNLLGDNGNISFPPPNPTNEATYAVVTTNQLLGPQIGFEYDTIMPWPKWISVGLTAKAAYCVDFSDTDHSLIRSDGFVGFNTTRNEVGYSSFMLDGTAFVEIHPMERFRIRAGYDFLWLAGVKLSQDQIDFNLNNPQGNDVKHGSVYFQGPTLDFEFLF